MGLTSQEDAASYLGNAGPAVSHLGVQASSSDQQSTGGTGPEMLGFSNFGIVFIMLPQGEDQSVTTSQGQMYGQVNKKKKKKKKKKVNTEERKTHGVVRPRENSCHFISKPILLCHNGNSSKPISKGFYETQFFINYDLGGRVCYNLSIIQL